MQQRNHSVATAFAANGIGWEGGDGSAHRRRSVILTIASYVEGVRVG